LTAAKCRNGQRRKPVKLGKPFCSKTDQRILKISQNRFHVYGHSA
jgi:hypothetical protein